MVEEATKEQKSQAVDLFITIAQVIREAGAIPNGHLYAQVMDRIDIGAYTVMIDSLKRTGLVSESHHLLTWKGE